jgi:hypothetical protein
LRNNNLENTRDKRSRRQQRNWLCCCLHSFCFFFFVFLLVIRLSYLIPVFVVLLLFSFTISALRWFPICDRNGWIRFFRLSRRFLTRWNLLR